jgi:protein phosphatase
MKVSYCSKTDLGIKHPINSDALGDKKTKNGHVFVVADGSPVDANGSFASRLAVQSILDFFEKEIFDNVFIGINHAFQFANEQVYRASILEEGLKGIYASVAVVLFREEGVYHAHIGNARVYLKSEGKLNRLTTDHGFLDVQVYPSNDVDYSKPLVKLPKALGNTPSVSPSICNQKVDVAVGDVFIVCTNGITKVLDDNYLNNKVEYATINSTILELVDAAKGKSAPENITLQLISVTEGNIQKKVVAASSSYTQSTATASRTVEPTNVPKEEISQEQLNLFNKISLDRNKTIKIGAAIIAVFVAIWFVFRQPHDDTDKVLDDAGEVIPTDTTNQHQDLEELMEYEKPKKQEETQEEEVDEEEVTTDDETTEEEPADATDVEESATVNQDATTKPVEKKEEKKKEEKKKEDKKEKTGKSKTHIVKSGDTINALAIKYGVKADAIRKTNNISDDKIEIGQELKIPQ